MDKAGKLGGQVTRAWRGLRLGFHCRSQEQAGGFCSQLTTDQLPRLSSLLCSNICSLTQGNPEFLSRLRRASSVCSELIDNQNPHAGLEDLAVCFEKAESGCESQNNGEKSEILNEELTTNSRSLGFQTLQTVHRRENHRLESRCLRTLPAYV